MRKILITTPYFLPNISGITMYIDILAKKMQEKKYEVVILTSQHEKNLPKKENYHGVTIIRTKPWLKIGKGLICSSLLWQVPIECAKATVVNCHLPQFEAGWVSFWAKFFRKKLFLTHHTDLSFWKGWKNKIIDSSVYISQMIAGILADKIIPYTADYAQNSYYLNKFSKKIYPILPPIYFEKQKNERLNRKLKEIIKGKKNIIGFCGRIAKQKGLEVLIEASDYLEDYLILLAGPTQIIGENYFEFLQKKYKKKLEKNFVFLGNINRNELATFYKNLDVLVLPSDDKLESFGWVQVEAMLCKVPCVATNMPGMREPIRLTGMGILFRKNDAQDLARKLKTVLKQKKFYTQKFNPDLEIFQPESSIDKYEKLFFKN